MDVEYTCGAWLEIWSCFPSASHGQRWFVDRCTADTKNTVADCASAAEADEAAARLRLPVVYIQE